jgi:radical S-adenosyl methionine domain-containing protein 2
LNCQDGGKKPGRSLLKVGVEEALKDAGFDNQAFLDRGGVFEWSKDRADQTYTDALDW